MKGIQTAAKVAMKILEIGHWVAVGLMSAVAVLALAAPAYLKYVMDIEAVMADPELQVYGFSVLAADVTGIQHTTLFLFAIGGIAVFALMAMVFRNLYCVIKRAENATPFSTENIRSLKWIGRFCMIVPLVGLLMSVVIRLVVGTEAVEISMDQSGLIMGLVVLCLTEYFTHGAKLEQEVDGLV